MRPVLCQTELYCQVGRGWNRTTIANERNRTVSDTVVPTIQGALPSGTDKIWTCDRSVISRVLYHWATVPRSKRVELNHRHHVLQTCALPTELLPEIVPTGFEPVSTLWKSVVLGRLDDGTRWEGYPTRSCLRITLRSLMNPAIIRWWLEIPPQFQLLLRHSSANWQPLKNAWRFVLMISNDPYGIRTRDLHRDRVAS